MSVHSIEPALASAALLPASPSDRHFDLGFRPYQPRRPLADRSRAESLLWASLALADRLERWQAPLRALQRLVGRDGAIFGVALRSDQLEWEVLLQNPSVGPRRGILARVAEALAPWIAVAPTADADSYALLGLRLTDEVAARGQILEVELHTPGPDGETRIDRVGPEGRATITRERRLAPTRDIDAVLRAIKASAHVDFAADRRLLGRVLIPELFACRELVIRNVEGRDGLCFVGVAVDQLRFFLGRFPFPAALRELVVRHEAKFEHLYFDVAVDYRQDPAGALVYPRASFHGTF